MEYILAIDETGDFNILNNNDNSFVCGVLMPKNDELLWEKFDEAKQKLYGDNTDSSHSLKDDNNKELFHYCELSSIKKRNLKNIFLRPSIIHKVFISYGKPIVFANNQNWWQIALMCVIKKAISSLTANDTLEIAIDPRSMLVLGIGFDTFKVRKEDRDNTTISIPWENVSSLNIDRIGTSALSLKIDSKDSRNDAIKIGLDNNITITLSKINRNRHNNSSTFYRYHGVIQKQLYEVFNNRRIKFSSSASNHYVALADIFCGFINDEFYKEAIKCPCVDYMLDDGENMIP